MTSRRDFLFTVGAAALAGCAPQGKPPLPPGEIVGMDAGRGHRLRQGDFPPPSEPPVLSVFPPQAVNEDTVITAATAIANNFMIFFFFIVVSAPSLFYNSATI